MINIKFVLINDDNSELELESKIFNDANSIHDSNICNFVYNKVVFELDNKYNFIDYENCPYVEIRYFDSNENLIYSEDCTDYMFNL